MFRKRFPGLIRWEAMSTAQQRMLFIECQLRHTSFVHTNSEHRRVKPERRWRVAQYIALTFDGYLLIDNLQQSNLGLATIIGMVALCDPMALAKDQYR